MGRLKRFGVLGVFVSFFFIITLGMLYSEETQVEVEASNETGFDILSFQLVYGRNIQAINYWEKEAEEICYVFLPSYAHDQLVINLDQEHYITVDHHILKHGKTFQIEEYDRTYSFKIYNLDNVKIDEKTFVFVKSQNVSAMFIELYNEDLDYIHEDKSNKDTAYMSLVDAEGHSVYNNKLKTFKGRGNATWEQDKKPYNITLESAVSLLDMSESDKWTLLANPLDPSNLRNTIVYDMAREAGFAYTPQLAYIDLYVNGEYMGLYQLAERIEVASNRVDISDLEKETRSVNSGVKLDTFNRFKIIKNDIYMKGYDVANNPFDITGGYLLEFELPVRYQEESSGFITRHGQHIVVSSPEHASREQISYISSYMQEVEDAIYAENGINPDTGKSIQEYIDLESWVKKYLIEEISANLDSGLTSQYYYKLKNSVSSLLYSGPVWDYDNSLGMGGIIYGRPDRLYVNRSNRKENHYTVYWYPELYKHEFFYEALIKEYAEVFLPILENVISEKLTVYKEEIYVADLLNSIRWDTVELEDVFSLVNDRIEKNVMEIREFLSIRKEFLNSIWLEDTIYYTVFFNVEGYMNRNIYMSVQEGGTVYEVPEPQRKSWVFIGWFYEGTETPFDPEAPVTEDIFLYSRWELSSEEEVDADE